MKSSSNNYFVKYSAYAICTLVFLLATLYLIGIRFPGSTQNDHREILTQHLQLKSLALSSSRSLAATKDPITGDSFTTINGAVPVTSCPLGKYRPAGSTDMTRVTGQRTDGCVYCPRGRYGSSPTLTQRTCTASCPTGRYGPTLGATSVRDCSFCPAGKYGAQTGLVQETCSGRCPKGFYSNVVGLTSIGQCKKCITGYRGWQCNSWTSFPPRPGTEDLIVGMGDKPQPPDRILE